MTNSPIGFNKRVGRSLWHGALRVVIATTMLLGVCAFAAQAKSKKILVLTTDSLTATTRTISGLTTTIRQQYPEAIFSLYRLTSAGLMTQSSMDSLLEFNPSVIVTVGSDATKVAQREFSGVPLVFSSVLYPELSGFVSDKFQPKDNITGASLDISIDIQFWNFKKIIPKLKKIGVLYTSNTASLIPRAQRAAADSGLTLVAIQINNEKELPGAIDSLTKTCQGIWSLADPNLFTPQSTKYILLHSMKKNIPVMGFSRNVVESGALFALDFDYKAIGRQTGIIVNAILGGGKPSGIAVTSPDVIWFHYNERTAQYMQITIPPDLVAVAKEVYR
ncbi:MAG: ABC transporter substrate binding protein [candidate division Zixibacteria bacterium]|nr:ABC transporter substrate binding protein [candidate division Zixibacteria bacterium]